MDVMTVTVTQLNRKITFMLGAEKSFADLCVKGEISNLHIHAASGHIYFTLKDENSSVRAVMFKNYAEKLKFRPEDGMSVIVRGSVKCFERDGVYQIYAASMTVDGAGALAVSFEQLKEKLKKEGLFDRKRPIPELPEKICVITSETGAVLQDIRNVLGRRYPAVKVVLVPAAVQGENAPASIVRAFGIANGTDADVIIFGRGGGSAEDLSCFNDESVARAIFASRIPTISAVGHETDFTIADFTADMRAPTPSAAAELAVPDKQELEKALDNRKKAIGQMLYRIIDSKTVAVKLKSSEIRAKSPGSRIAANEQKLNAVTYSIRQKMSAIEKMHDMRVNSLYGSISLKARIGIEAKRNALMRTVGVIEALNPLAVLMRGYSITYRNGKAVVSADELNIGDNVEIRFAEGTVNAEIIKNA